MKATEGTIPGAADLSGIVPLFRELGDLKRVHAAGAEGSVAAASFRRSWAALVVGADLRETAVRETATAVAAARLGALDAARLRALGLGDDEALAALQKGFDSVASPLPEAWLAELRGALEDEPDAAHDRAPAFVVELESQPRAGATRPGRGRVVLEPPESHAEHCWAVAVYGALLSDGFGADAGVVFLAGLSHHLHNASLPDSGHAADVILAPYVGKLQATAREKALSELSDALRDAVTGALETLVGRTDNPEARAFQAADVLDRVLQMEHYARAASFTLDQALDEMDIVHPGPEQEFHQKVLSEAGLH